MPNACDNCRFLRRFRPMSQLLARDLGVTDQALVSELLKIMQEERGQRDAEAELKAKLFENRDVRWPYRPHVSDYCGLREGDGEYYVHELKNRAGGCGDWKAGETALKECSACTHQQVGTGNARDAQVMSTLARAQENAAALGRSAPDQSNNYIQLVGTKKAFEAAQTFYAGRIAGDPPEYVSTCRKYSRAGHIIPCVAQNPSGTCVGWESRDPVAAPAAQGGGQPSIMDALSKLPRKATR